MSVELTTKTGNVAVLAPEGDLDLYSSGDLKDRVVALWHEGCSGIICDLANVDYIDSSGIGVLLYIFTGCQKRKLPARFAAVTPSVMKTLELTNLESFLPLSPTVDEALEKIPTDSEATDRRKSERRGIEVDGSSSLLNREGMTHRVFNIDISHVRRLSNLIAQQAPQEIREINMLEQQISELIKNAVRHGNKNDPNKSVYIWFSFDAWRARLIVEDEGEGFQNIEEWNEFYRKRTECYQRGDYEEMLNYLQFRTAESSEDDGGNALFAAIEYWNDGIVFNDARNAVAVQRSFRS
jgi:anti-anti-sigma factor